MSGNSDDRHSPQPVDVRAVGVEAPSGAVNRPYTLGALIIRIGFRVWGLGLGLGFRVWGLGFRV